MRISIALATYNGSVWIGRQLASLAMQQRKPDELVAFDDCSTDDSGAILRRFAAASPFPVRIEIQPANLGPTRNFQSAIAACTGDFIATCDQDDVWYPDKLRRIEQLAIAEPGVDLIFSDADVVDDRLAPMGYRLWDSLGFSGPIRAACGQTGLVPLLSRFNVVAGAAMAFSAGRRDLLLPIPDGWVHDAWIAMILSMIGRCRWIDEPLLAYRQHPGQQIGGRRLSIREQIAAAGKMDAAYFDLLARNFQAVRERLTNIPDVKFLPLIDRKISHCVARRDMRKSGDGKWPAILRQWAAGNYRACSLGWKSMAQDVFLA